MSLGDSRTGKLAGNLAAFGRTLRRAGVQVDSARIGLCARAALEVGLADRHDLSAAMESVLISREQDRAVFRELFDAFFRDPNMAHKLLSQMLPSAEGKAEPSKRRPRVREALSPPKLRGQQAKPKTEDQKVDFDAAMTASDIHRLRHADFNALSASEYGLVERLARDIALPLPQHASRRMRPGTHGNQLHWSGVLRSAVRLGGETLHLPKRERRQQPLPLLVLVDVSGSMERYARLLLAFLHAATRKHPRRAVFAFGTQLTELSGAFKLGDTDAMLDHANALIEDFAGGTQLGKSLASLREHHARTLVGRRTMVLIVTDGLDTGEPQELAQELAWLQLHTRRILWLNPLLRFDGYAPLAQGAQALNQVAHGMVAIHNLTKLEDLASSLAKLMKQ
jgi:uncharacterized protein with von Willebrand factor type A (vWA) domain